MPLLLFLALTSGAFAPGAGLLVATGETRGGPGNSVVRIEVRSQAHLDAVAGELDIWEARAEDGYAVAAISEDQRAWLEDLGYSVRFLEAQTAGLETTAALDPRYYHFDNQVPNAYGRYIVEFLEDLEAAHPDITQLMDIGDAWMAGQPGHPDRDLWLMRVTSENPAFGPIDEKPAFFLSAAMHAREVASAELAIRYLKHLTTGYDGKGGYGRDPDVTWLVDHHVCYVLAMHNPDGHAENERDTGANRRKNMDWDDGCLDSYDWGVDLNRNHSFLWGCCGGSSANPCSITYRGPAPASEPETQAFESTVTALMGDQNGPNGDNEIAAASPLTTTGILISLHSYGDMVLWPWGFDDYGDAPNEAGLRTIGRKFASYNGYDASGSIGYKVDGAADDWAYGKLGIPAYTFEVGAAPWDDGECGGFFPRYECIDGYPGTDFWAENRPAFLYAHKIARAPYATAYGPDTESVTVSGSGPAVTAAVTVTAVVEDQRCCGDSLRAVVGAEVFLDVPGGDGEGVPAHPKDGAWDGTSELVETEMDVSALTPGRHVVLVRGRNDEGVWGPFSAAFLWVGERTYLPIIRAGELSR